jgi:hypothetical protein
MPQSEVLGGHRGPRAKEGDEGRQKGSSQAEYAERIRAENESEGPARGAVLVIRLQVFRERVSHRAQQGI